MAMTPAQLSFSIFIIFMCARAARTVCRVQAHSMGFSTARTRKATLTLLLRCSCGCCQVHAGEACG